MASKKDTPENGTDESRCSQVKRFVLEVGGGEGGGEGGANENSDHKLLKTENRGKTSRIVTS